MHSEDSNCSEGGNVVFVYEQINGFFRELLKMPEQTKIPLHHGYLVRPVFPWLQY